MKTTECVGCGCCCMKAPCDASRRLYGTIKECPQLMWDEQKDRYICGLMIISGMVGEGYRQELSAGAGCCMGMNTWRLDVKKRVVMDSSPYANPLPKLLQLFIRCLSAEFISGDVIVLTMGRLKGMLKADGYSDEDIESIVQHIVRLFLENRSTFTKEFIG